VLDSQNPIKGSLAGFAVVCCALTADMRRLARVILRLADYDELRYLNGDPWSEKASAVVVCRFSRN